ncbi:hypothetical protein ES677_00765 [Bizionia gelidisalsuginis]|uniref:YhhN-like protein n=1 Tax=Bizionia gelidisalsuginis TaxID=291188 RepID=A0ABY3MEH3_9FLAO|nr:hypothetical protein [Bizionia gelidisalsuginis]TYC17938.1 hypothetical protein ES677_00765 [Bizionia gelidisalsuginis]
MNISKSQIISVILAILAVAYVLSVVFKLKEIPIFSRALIFPLFVVHYFLQSKKTDYFFLGFLVLFSMSEILIIFDAVDSFPSYYVGNGMCILAYFSLALFFIKKISFLVLFNRFKTFVTVLLVLSSYIVYVLNSIVLDESGIHVWSIDFFLESFYNLSITMVLSLSLLNYLCRDSKDDLLLFLATACIVFSEMVHLASFYISEVYILGLTNAILLTAGFSLVHFYITSKVNTYYRVLF